MNTNYMAELNQLMLGYNELYKNYTDLSTEVSRTPLPGNAAAHLQAAIQGIQTVCTKTLNEIDGYKKSLAANPIPNNQQALDQFIETATERLHTLQNQLLPIQTMFLSNDPDHSPDNDSGPSFN